MMIFTNAVALAIRAAFRKKIAVAPDGFEEMTKCVKVVKNLKYPSKYRSNSADIYIPKNKKGPFPTVLWIHGGAFTGGDKKDAEIYATALAAEGIAVVCMNYRRAPEAKYPAPVVQTDEAYLWLGSISDEYALDTSRFILAGDSAGAHIAAQYAAVQSNADYADKMGFEQSIPLHTLKAILLFCGPYDVAKMDESSNRIVNFFIGRAARAYFGKKDWTTFFSAQATISNHVTSCFPSAFISDGNTLSFESHGRELAAALESKGVPVETYFISADTEKAGHEYQFIMNTAAGKESFDRVTGFVWRCVGLGAELRVD